MNVFRPLSNIGSWLALSALLAGCGLQTAPPVAPQSLANGARAHMRGPYDYVLVDGGISVYVSGRTNPLRGILVPGLASAIGCDGLNSDLWVANSDFNSLTEYVQGGKIVERTITGLHSPVALAFDSRTSIYVANQSANDVTILSSQPGFASHTISDGIRNPAKLAVDRHDTLYVLNSRGTGSIAAFRPHATHLWHTIVSGIDRPYAIAVDGQDTVYVGNAGPKGSAGWISEYARGASKPVRKITSGIFAPEAIAADRWGTLYVANATRGTSAKGWLTVYAAKTTTPSQSIQTGTDLPLWMSLDFRGNLIVTNASNVDAGSVAVYEPPKMRLVDRIVKGLSNPLAAVACLN